MKVYSVDLFLKKCRNVFVEVASNGQGGITPPDKRMRRPAHRNSRAPAVLRGAFVSKREVPMKRTTAAIAGIGMAGILGSVFAFADPPSSPSSGDGQAIFRFDTFGDEQLWTDTL